MNRTFVRVSKVKAAVLTFAGMVGRMRGGMRPISAVRKIKIQAAFNSIDKVGRVMVGTEMIFEMRGSVVAEFERLTFSSGSRALFNSRAPDIITGSRDIGHSSLVRRSHERTMDRQDMIAKAADMAIACA